MNRSEEIGSLAAALAKAQGAIRSAIKDSTNPHLKSKYADLANVWDAVRAPLSANSLAIFQQVSANGDVVSVATTLAHESGQWICSTLDLRAVKGDPQGIGSAITYARRYSLSALVGVAADDDDGNAASAPPKKTEAKADNAEALKSFYSASKSAFGGDKARANEFLSAKGLTLSALQSLPAHALESLEEELPLPEAPKPEPEPKAETSGLDTAKVTRAFWAACNKAKLPEAVAYAIGRKEFEFFFDAGKGRPSLTGTPLSNIAACTRYISEMTQAEIKEAIDAELAAK